MCGYPVSPWDHPGPCTRVKDHVGCSLVQRRRSDWQRRTLRPGASPGWTCGVPPGRSRPVNGLNHVHGLASDMGDPVRHPPLKPFIGACVDSQWVHGTCLDPVQESKTTRVAPLPTGKGRTGNGACDDLELHLDGPGEFLLARAGQGTAWTMYLGWPQTRLVAQ